MSRSWYMTKLLPDRLIHKSDPGRFCRTARSGAVLLVVLFVVMTITILAFGYLARTDIELACGNNMLLRTDVDYLAESGLEHAKGLIISPQDINADYWRGANAQQLTPGSDNYYDVNVTRLSACNYQIISDAYIRKGGEKIAAGSLLAELRLDPCIAFWAGQSSTLCSPVTINGDVYCNGTLLTDGPINGDVFADAYSGSGARLGRLYPKANLTLDWPQVTVQDFTSNYVVLPIGTGSLPAGTILPGSSAKVCFRNGNLTLSGNVTIDAMLIVDGDLTVQGIANRITAPKNLPAVLVTGDLTVDSAAALDVNGLAVVDGQMKVSAGAGAIVIAGGLFVGDDLVHTTADSSGSGRFGQLINSPAPCPSSGYIGGAVNFDGTNDKIEQSGAAGYLNGLSAVTVSCWIKSDVTNQDRGILFTREPTDSDEELGFRYDKDGAYGGGRSCIKASIRTATGFTQIETGSSVQTTNWQHLALVWRSGQSLVLYINGTPASLLYNSGPVSGTTSGVQKIMLGRDTKGKYWDGMIDDFRIYNCALDPNGIPPVGPSPNLLVHWKLDEPTPGNITITPAPSKSAIIVRPGPAVTEKWQQAAGAFFKRIERR